LFKQIVEEGIKRERFDELMRLSDWNWNEIGRFAVTNTPVPLGPLIVLPPQAVMDPAADCLDKL
jgi:hypothetical protein